MPEAKLRTADNRILKPLPPREIVSGEYSRRIYVGTCPVETMVEDLENPRYWALLAPQLRAMDRVELLRADNAWWAEMLVVYPGRNEVRMQVLRILNIDTALPAEADGYKVQWSNPKLKWQVIRLADKQVVSEGHDTADIANTWLIQHRATMGRVQLA